MLKVFISWSGVTSQQIATIFHDWLPTVLQGVEPYMSTEDLTKGKRWGHSLASELQDSQFGLVCVTKENMREPWLSFEAGAISKVIDDSNVTPFLYDLTGSELQGPLANFQATHFNKQDLFRLVGDINELLGDLKLPDERLKKIYDVFWPEFETQLRAIPPTTKAIATEPPTKTESILEELLELSRRQQQILGSPEKLFPPELFGGSINPIFATPDWTSKLSLLAIEANRTAHTLLFAPQDENRSVLIHSNAEKVRDLTAHISQMYESGSSTSKYPMSQKKRLLSRFLGASGLSSVAPPPLPTPEFGDTTASPSPPPT